MKIESRDLKLAVVGLGYVGLPLAVEFAKKRIVIGFDLKKKRVNELNFGIDRNLELEKKNLNKIKKIKFTSNINDLKLVNCYIICVPTPINKFKKPDLKPIARASEIIGKIIKKGDLIIYESTVYPGCTEEVCVPILEKFSNLKLNKDFFCGYSPERINPGDKQNTISTIKKVTSGSTPEIADVVDDLYSQIIKAGTFKASSIRVAEAAKVIENTQRDLNIAFINELSILFKKMNLDTQEILDAAGTKWNFLPFKPGLVGGHCIGVDPYYLTYKANMIGYKPRIILAGRNINDNMGKYVVSQFIIEMKKKSIQIKKAKILIMGLTFKENCLDIRNSGSQIIVNELNKLGCDLDLYDPVANKMDIKKTYGVLPITKLIKNTYDGIIITVAHDYFKNMEFETIRRLCKKNYAIYDLKYIFNSNQVSLRL
jgi:UDP-N-acetyl-D-glucosamine/UDP-N-acetyl-D-galactosamine dehydrogenase